MNLSKKTPSRSSVRADHSWLDFCGLLASIGCAIHCALMPFIISYLPMLGLSWFADESFHFWMALVCFVIAISAFVPGYRKHKNLLPMAFGTIGVTVLLGHSLVGCECCEDAICKNDNPILANWKYLSPWIPPLGGIFLIVAHLTNHLKGCHCCCEKPPVGSASSLGNSSSTLVEKLES